MQDVRVGRAAMKAALLVVLGLAMSACAGTSGEARDDALLQGPPGHLDYVTADATFVVSVNHMDSRVKKIRGSKALAQIKRAIVKRTDNADMAELGELARKSDGAFDLLETLLQGKVTLAMYDEPAAPGESASGPQFVLIADANVEEMFVALAKLDGADVPEFVDAGDGIRKLGGESAEPLFLIQSGGIGMASPSKAMLKRTMEIGSGGGAGSRKLLVDDEAYKKLASGLRKDADLFVFVPDWRTGSDEWGDLLGKGVENSAPRGVAAVVMLDEGFDVEMLIEFDERDMEDEDLKELLPALRGKDTPLQIPAMLPPDALGYIGLEVQMETLIGLFNKQGELGLDLPPEQEAEIRSVLKELMASFSGEFGVAVTSMAPNAPLSALLGMPVPGAVLVGELSSPEVASRVMKIVQGLMELVQAAAQPFGAARVEARHGVDVRVYPLNDDPALEVAFATVGGQFLLGTRAGVSDVLRAVSSGKGLMAAATHPLVKRSLSAPGNYAAYANLKAIYQVLLTSYAPVLGMMTDGLLGTGDDDPLALLFEIFQYGGASMVYREGASTIRFYLAADDLP